jgi:hypothetical protein
VNESDVAVSTASSTGSVSREWTCGLGWT